MKPHGEDAASDLFTMAGHGAAYGDQSEDRDGDRAAHSWRHFPLKTLSAHADRLYQLRWGFVRKWNPPGLPEHHHAFVIDAPAMFA